MTVGGARRPVFGVVLGGAGDWYFRTGSVRATAAAGRALCNGLHDATRAWGEAFGPCRRPRRDQAARPLGRALAWARPGTAAPVVCPRLSRWGARSAMASR